MIHLDVHLQDFDPILSPTQLIDLLPRVFGYPIFKATLPIFRTEDDMILAFIQRMR